MKIGKMAANDLKKTILDKIEYNRDDVLIHAGIGEDCSVVDFGDEVLVISSDPITGATANAGYLAVHVACNDLAATGAKPVGVQVVLLLPSNLAYDKAGKLMKEIHDTAAEIGAEVLGGHTEILSYLDCPVIITTAVGKADKNAYIPTGGARPGDDIILTKGAGIEGTYILANDYDKLLLTKGVLPAVIKKAQGFGSLISVLPEGMIAARMGAHSLHDVTEGGLYGALEEMAEAADAGFILYKDQIPVRDETRLITDVLDIDPGGLISSGSMLIATDHGEELLDELIQAGINAFIIGKIIGKDEGKFFQNKYGEKKDFNWQGEDELWRIMRELEI